MNILIYAEVRQGKLKNTALELLTLAQSLNPTAIDIALFSEDAGILKSFEGFSIREIFVISGVSLYQNDIVLNSLKKIITNSSYDCILGPASPTGRDLFPRLSAQLKAGLLTEVIDLKKENNKLVATRPIYAGKCLVTCSSTTPLTLVTLRPNVIAIQKPAASASPKVTNQVAEKSSLPLKVVELRQGKSTRPDLTEATLIISGGRAMANSDNFKILFEAADVIGASVGASRAAVDSGYAPHEMQVGQTGKTVNPNLYIACGISGSIQHLAGMRTSKIIVAINTDADAPIFQKADYGIVADLFKAVPVLTEEFKKLKSKE